MSAALPTNDIAKTAEEFLLRAHGAESDRNLSEICFEAYALFVPILEKGTPAQKNKLVDGLASGIAQVDPYYQPGYHGSIDCMLNSVFQGRSEDWVGRITKSVAQSMPVREDKTPIRMGKKAHPLQF